MHYCGDFRTSYEKDSEIFQTPFIKICMALFLALLLALRNLHQGRADRHGAARHRILHKTRTVGVGAGQGLDPFGPDDLAHHPDHEHRLPAERRDQEISDSPGRGQADKARAMAAAKEAGLDVARIEKDLNSDEVKASLEESFKLAEKLGLNGTPSYVIGENVVVGAVGLAALKEKVNTARCGKATC